jgi:alkylated DNA repair dioxygenase AlkB
LDRSATIIEQVFYTVSMVLTAIQRPVSAALQTSMQTSLFGSGELICGPLTVQPQPLDEHSSLLFEPGWLQGSDAVFDQLRNEMAWRAMERPMYDRIVAVPRLICSVDPRSLDGAHPIAKITRALESVLQGHFASVGLNFYRTGDDSVAWHRDSIYTTGRPRTVALVSLGSPRTLALRPHASHPSKTAETTGISPATARRWRLGHGDLFVMQGRCQHDWEHSVPKERAGSPRISLAFRCQERSEGPRSTGAGVPPLLASRELQLCSRTVSGGQQ